MKHFKSKGFHFSWIASITLAGLAIFLIHQKYPDPGPINIPATNHQLSPTPTKDSLTPTPTETASNQLPTTFLLKVPFSPQAPTANWDELHNEACEETSVIMVERYFSGDTSATLKPELVESELNKITEWEKQTFGYYLDIDSEETAKLLREVYGLKTRLEKNMTEEHIKEELKAGNLVIWSANGRKLGNPNFRQPGPPYHMLVIKGWDKNGFITNDPGTRKGRNYPYTYETLFNAAGAWSHNLNAVDEGNKTALVVWK
jgi:hypothetical protein